MRCRRVVGGGGGYGVGSKQACMEASLPRMLAAGTGIQAPGLCAVAWVPDSLLPCRSCRPWHHSRAGLHRQLQLRVDQILAALRGQKEKVALSFLAQRDRYAQAMQNAEHTRAAHCALRVPRKPCHSGPLHPPPVRAAREARLHPSGQPAWQGSLTGPALPGPSCGYIPVARVGARVRQPLSAAYTAQI